MVLEVTPIADKQIKALPVPIRIRMYGIFERLAAWPNISGAKPLRGNLAGSFRICTGDYRIVFKVVGERIVVWKIGDRKDGYLD